jgi:glycosyltransferase involved in cell wall biosynthesis
MPNSSARPEKNSYEGQKLLNVLLYSEGDAFGGHEKMALAAHLALNQQVPNIGLSWIINEKNVRLGVALEEAGLRYRPLNMEPAFRYCRNPISVGRKLKRVIRAFREEDPALVLLVQGGITNGYDSVFAACLTRIPLCSYIPMAHTSDELGKYRFPNLWRAVRRMFFRLIPSYITIDPSQADRLRKENPAAKVFVVENFIERPPEQRTSSDMAKRIFGIPEERNVVAVIGRIDFNQKAQHLVIESLEKGSFMDDKIVIFVGDGPDREHLSHRIQSSPRKNHFMILDWRENLEDIFALANVILIPSRFEGVPLVMLEALARHKVVIGTDRDGMRSWLPPSWRFGFGHEVEIRKAIENGLESRYVDWDKIDSQMANIMNEGRFAADFSRALMGISTSSFKG